MTYCKVSHCRFSDSHTTKNHLCGRCKKYGHGIIECNNNFLMQNLQKFYNEKIDDSNKCKFGGCIDKDYHTTNGHHCENCNDRLHSLVTCPLLYKGIKKDDTYEVKCPICKTDNIINNNQSKIYGIEELCIICMDKNKEVFFPICGHICVCIDCNNKLKKVKINNQLNYVDYDEQKLKTILKDYPTYTIVYQGMGCICIFKRFNISSEIENLFIHSDDHYTEDVNKKTDDFINGYAFIDYNI